MIEHQTVDDLLLAHAAGRLPVPVALAVATHLALNAAARARYRRYEAVGGVLLEALEPEALTADAWARMEARLDADPGEPRRHDPPAPADDLLLPRPLRDYLPAPLHRLRWRNYGPVAEIELPLGVAGYRTSLVRVRAGRSVPQHTHAGRELTLVLDGAFHDATGHYRRGDLVLANGTLDHSPIADEGRDCLCLAVTDAPRRLTGRLGRLLNPFIRF
jgi:putative transcriptional regulator